MDINDVRSLVTLLSLGLFVSLMVWTYWPARNQAHQQAAQLPFAGEAGEPGEAGTAQSGATQ
jgi:cbb3-type cytochrome oxidase subunit 3